MKKIEEKYMRRCIELAKSVHHSVVPNPMVGAVVVHNDKIIGEGFHAIYGSHHAEVNAIRSVSDESLLQSSTIYVSLEPCAHYGKTPPCAQLIIDKKIPRVVIGCIDPFPKVSGRGIDMLKEAGIEVVTGILEQECLELNKRFITFHSKKRPYIILKWAQSADGLIDKSRSSWREPAFVISSPATQTRVHKLRAEVTAIMVGTQTALLDNPSLTVRHWEGKNPLRIVIDRELRIPATHRLLDNSTPTWVITEKKYPSTENTHYLQLNLREKGMVALFDALYQAGYQSLLVEGGATLHQIFIDNGWWDEALVEVSTAQIGKGIAAACLKKATLTDTPELIDGHILQHFVHNA